MGEVILQSQEKEKKGENGSLPSRGRGSGPPPYKRRYFKLTWGEGLGEGERGSRGKSNNQT